MVSLSSLFFASVAIAAVTAQSSSAQSSLVLEEKANNDRYVSLVSRQIVRAFTDIRSPNVKAAQASSEAEHFVTALLDYPGFQKLIQNLPTQINEGENTYSHAASVLNQVSKAYDEWSKGPNFAPYTSYFKAHITDFDVQKGISNVQKTAREFYPIVSEPVKQFFADPQGKVIGKSAANLARHFVSDIGLGKYANQIPEAPPIEQPLPAPAQPVYYTQTEDDGCGYNNIKPAPEPEPETSSGCY